MSEVPSDEGLFGVYGGAFVAEPALAHLQQLDALYGRACGDAGFWDELLSHLRTLAGRATPLYAAEGLTAHARGRLPRGEGARLWLKREDLAYSGSNSINHALGFALLAVKANKRRLIGPAAGGLHAVAVATAAAHFGLECEIFSPAEDVAATAAELARVRVLGARVREIPAGVGRVEALAAVWDEWVDSAAGTMLVPSAAYGPSPFPGIVRDFQSIVGRETKAQSLRQLTKLPDVIVSAVGIGCEAAGIFYPFIDDSSVKLVGVEAGGRSGAPGDHAAPLSMGRRGTMLGQATYTLADQDGKPLAVQSAAGGMAYPLAGPEHAYWKDAGRVRYTVAGDEEALHAMGLLARTEGIVASLEAAHGVAEALKLASELKADQNIVINLAGRGDKDVDLASRFLGSREKP